MQPFIAVFIEKSPHQQTLFNIISSIHFEISNRNYSTAINFCDDAIDLCNRSKNYALNSIKNESLANSSFIISEYCLMLKNYSIYWQLLSHSKFKDSWNFLQNTLDKLINFSRLSNNHENYFLSKFQNHLNQLEKLYPYNLFSSIEAVVQTYRCSICKKSLLDLNCTHLLGELYWGEQAYAVAEDIVLQAVAIVENPMDKRCILEISDDKRTEEEKFAILRDFITNNNNPLQLFSLIEEERFYYNDNYKNTRRNDPCPCHSGKKFKKCCGLNKYKKGIHLHIQLTDVLEIESIL